MYWLTSGTLAGALAGGIKEAAGDCWYSGGRDGTLSRSDSDLADSGGLGSGSVGRTTEIGYTGKILSKAQ
jgi:hypothetical protein